MFVLIKNYFVQDPSLDLNFLLRFWNVMKILEWFQKLKSQIMYLVSKCKRTLLSWAVSDGFFGKSKHFLYLICWYQISLKAEERFLSIMKITHMVYLLCGHPKNYESASDRKKGYKLRSISLFPTLSLWSKTVYLDSRKYLHIWPVVFV